MRRGTLLINRVGNIVAMVARQDGEASAKSSTRAVIIWRDSRVDPSLAAIGAIFDANLVSGDWTKVDPLKQYVLAQPAEYEIGDVVSPPAASIEYTITEETSPGIYKGVCIRADALASFRVGDVVRGIKGDCVTLVRKGRIA